MSPAARRRPGGVRRPALARRGAVGQPWACSCSGWSRTARRWTSTSAISTTRCSRSPSPVSGSTCSARGRDTAWGSSSSGSGWRLRSCTSVARPACTARRSQEERGSRGCRSGWCRWSMAAAGVAIMVFPTGQHLSRRWRAASRAMVGLATLVALASALWPIEDDWRSSDLVFPFDLGGQDVARAIGLAADAQLLLRLPGSCGPRRSSPGCAGPAVTRSASCGGSCSPWPCRCCSCSSGRSSGARRCSACSPSRWCRSRPEWRSSDTGSTTSTR